MFHEEDASADVHSYDLDDLQQNGEIIAVTLSGPDTYFQWRGQDFGLQYELAADFARTQGLRIQMETAHDTLELIQKLEEGQADVIVLPMSERKGYKLCGVQDSTKCLGWIVRDNSPRLCQAINEWYHPQLLEKMEWRKNSYLRSQSQPARHVRQPKMRDAAHGIVSPYDELFRRYARLCGWDWRLLAAQAYQESGFDPNAVSWAGAQGLMQLMPGTSADLGISPSVVFQPEANISGAVRVIQRLNTRLADVRNPDERIKFILASYNGGIGHVRDAMALAEKMGGDKYCWEDVARHMLLLSDPAYYRDPVVRYGYMRATETTGYVVSVLSHWQYYRSVVAR
ncbi:MAG: transglycosylase SLT domain-containing protein [Bacteroidales bacterium]|nr:transglycosylase SLT domain-containing protein [Candidatus Physcousia equi]